MECQLDFVAVAHLRLCDLFWVGCLIFMYENIGSHGDELCLRM